MKKKKVFYTEAVYALGLLSIAVGVGFMERADFGLSTIVAPAYILHRYISAMTGMEFFTFGVAEYTMQAILLILLTVIVRRFRLSYLFSFVTAVVYGYVLDLVLWLMPSLSSEQLGSRIIFFIIGEIFCAMGVSMMFRTYISPEVYELFVAQIADRFGFGTGKVKTVYDCVSCAAAIAMSFAFFGFGSFVGIGWGTIVCALINGFIISAFGRLWDRLFDFRDGLSLRKYFEKQIKAMSTK